MPHDDPYAGQTISGAWAYDLSRSVSYNPELTATTTSPNLGADGTAVGAYHRAGHLITGWARFQFSGTGVSAGSGVYLVSLPLAADTSLLTNATTVTTGDIVGHGYVRDSGTSANNQKVLAQLADTASLVRLYREATAGAVTDATPFTWATGDGLAVQFAYIADPSVL